jgi:hypothetical protein
VSDHTLYAAGELLKKTTSLYRRPHNPRYDILLDCAMLLREQKVREKDHLRILIADRQTFVVEERRGDRYQVVFRATFDGPGSLTFHEFLDGGWPNALSRWCEEEFNPQAS